MSFEFEYPYAFLLIIVYFLCIKFCKPRALALIFPNAALFKKVSKKSSILNNLLKFLAFLFLVIALASPIKKDEIALQNQKGYEIALILDASGSMRQNGKFRAVKEIVTNFIKKRKTDKIGLTIFADFAYVAVPLTYDKKSLLRLLSKIDVGVAGLRQTALYEALFLSTNLFKNSKAKDKVAILLTDGMDNTNSIPLNVAINTAKKYGIKVYTIGVGSGNDFNEEVLQEIANQTGAKFYNARSKRELNDIYNQINRLEKSEFKAQKYIKKSYYYQYFLALGILFLIIFAIGYRR